MFGFFKKLFRKKPALKPLYQLPANAADIVVPDRGSDDVANPDADIRIALADRLVKLLPAIETEAHSELYGFAVQALTALAQDEVLKVRRALSTALRDYAKAPPAVVARLARDVEREIAEPILRHCIALEDNVLLEILAGHPEPWAIAAIAARPTVSEKVTDAVFKAGDILGTALMIGNKGAQISRDTLQAIVDGARRHAEWQRPLALSPHLDIDLTRELTGFVSETILEVLKDRSDLDAATRLGVVSIVERRIAYTKNDGGQKTPADKVERFARDGRLTPELVHDALAWQERVFAVLAMAKMAGIPAETVERILGAGAKPVVALCWKAGFPARMCVDVQRLAGRIQPKDLLYPKGGTDYPLTQDEIAWQLEFFGAKK